MLVRFLIYGTVGWCMEILWTGLGSLLKRDYKMSATTSIWMFFIYGMAVFLEPICEFISLWPVLIRGGAYMLCIFSIEYITGGIMKKFRVIPWDYSGSKYSVNGLIRLDYAPVWFIAGIIFELVYKKLAFFTVI